MKFQAPENCGGVSVGGEFFAADENGVITISNGVANVADLASHGYVPIYEKEEVVEEVVKENLTPETAETEEVVEEVVKENLTPETAETEEVATETAETEEVATETAETEEVATETAETETKGKK